jgi:Ni,Fe-hydrogenase III component G
MLPDVEEVDKTVGSPTVPLAIEVQPLASVTVKLYAPADTVWGPVPEYGLVPPVAVTVTVVVPPWQRMLPDDEEANKTAGSVTVPLVFEIQPLASVTVKLYAPADTVCNPVPEYGVVPPVAVTVTVVVPPWQRMLPEEDEAETAVGSVTVPLVFELQPLASVTMKLYAPADTVCAPVPEYGLMPPVAVTVTVVVPPWQRMLPDDEDADKTAGSVTVPLVFELQPFASVTVKLYAPADTVCGPVPEYGLVPPVAVTVTVVVPPWQRMLPDDEETETAVGSVIITDVTNGRHPYLSDTITV